MQKKSVTRERVEERQEKRVGDAILKVKMFLIISTFLKNLSQGVEL